MEYFINPTTKPRMTGSDKWKKRRCVMVYRAYKDRVRSLAMELPVPGKVTFYIPMPLSWSKKKKELFNGKPHEQTPDLDNLVKGLLDALYEDDAHVWSLCAEKYWRDRPGIKIEPWSRA